MVKPRPTLKDVALACGVHHTTVSRSLHNNPSIPQATRDRVKQVADKLGYRPDLLLSALSARKRQTVSTRSIANLAWVTNFETRDGWKSYTHNLGYFRGCRERALKLGCSFDEIWVGDRKQAGIENLLKARGVQGVILAPQPLVSEDLEIAGDQFHLVTLGMSVARDDVTRVCHDHYHSVSNLIKKLASEGFKKPIFYARKHIDERVDFTMSHGFGFGVQTSALKVSAAPVYIPKDTTSMALAKRIMQDKPDVAIVAYRDWIGLEQALHALGLSIPADVSVAVITVPEHDSEVGGVIENAGQMGSLAVDTLINLIINGSCESRKSPYRLVIDGTVTYGKTICRPETA